MNRLSRRRFLKTSAALASVLVASPAFLRSQSPGENLRVGFVGTGPMGRTDCRNFAQISDLIALCDLDESYGLAPAMKDEKINCRKIDTYQDYRKILDRKDIDIVGIATPDHWHTKIAIEALMAGKHVFCEKPLTLTVDEGRQIRNACKKYKRVFQVGTMQRSTERFQTAVLIVQKGYLGKLERIVCHIDGGLSCDTIPKASVPSTLDWNIWQGQVPETEYIATAEILEKFGCPLNTRGHHEFRWFFDYAGGKFTDWGAHHVDMALWALKQDQPGDGPTKITSVISEHPVPLKDGNPTVSDRYQTATKFQVDCQMPGDVILEISSHTPHGNGIFFKGSKGNLFVGRNRIKGNVFENQKVQQNFTQEDYIQLNGDRPLEDNNPLLANKKDFLTCIKEGGIPNSNVDSHVQEINLCHIACIATRLNRELVWDAKQECFVGDDYANTFLKREQRKGFEIPEI